MYCHGLFPLASWLDWQFQFLLGCRCVFGFLLLPWWSEFWTPSIFSEAQFFHSSTASLISMCLLNWLMDWRIRTLFITVSCRDTSTVCASWSALKYTCTMPEGSYFTFILLYCLRISFSVSSSSQKFSCRCLMIGCSVFPTNCPSLLHRSKNTGLRKMYFIISTAPFWCFFTPLNLFILL